jgi:hypothetical protein
MSSPAVGDVDGDGELEVAIRSDSSCCWLFEADGTVMDGWPRTVVSSGDFPPSSVLADIVGDGCLEVILVGKTGVVLVTDYLGNTLPGWPRDLGDNTSASPAVADVDDDPEMEIIIGCDSGKLYAFDIDGASRRMPTSSRPRPYATWTATVTTRSFSEEWTRMCTCGTAPGATTAATVWSGARSCTIPGERSCTASRLRRELTTEKMGCSVRGCSRWSRTARTRSIL